MKNETIEVLKTKSSDILFMRTFNIRIDGSQEPQVLRHGGAYEKGARNALGNDSTLAVSIRSLVEKLVLNSHHKSGVRVNVNFWFMFFVFWGHMMQNVCKPCPYL